MEFSEIKYQDVATKTYLGSPSIVRLDSGDLLAAHDYFGPGCPRNHENEEHLSSVYRSSDEGKTWVNVTHVAGQYWSTLFVHQGAVYLLGTSQQYGSIVIRRSEDNGNTWTHPMDSKSGLLSRGGPFREPPNYHCAPVPVLIKDGRLYRAFEDLDPLPRNMGFRSLVISAPVDADLLNAAEWTISSKLRFDVSWVPEDWGKLKSPGWFEGNVVETPSGEIWNILRFSAAPLVDKAAIVRVEKQGQWLTFDPKTGFIDFPGGGHKFTIRRDPMTGIYLTLANNSTDPAYHTQRNMLFLNKSVDLIHWEPVQLLLEDDLGLSWEESIRQTGFQYVDWQFDGEDIIYVVRTAYDGAHNRHDTNRMTFHKLQDFRFLL